jgi:hypothetical protein
LYFNKQLAINRAVMKAMILADTETTNRPDYMLILFICLSLAILLTVGLLHKFLKKIDWTSDWWKTREWLIKLLPEIVICIMAIAGLIWKADTLFSGWTVLVISGAVAVFLWKGLQYRIETVQKNHERIDKVEQKELIAELRRQQQALGEEIEFQTSLRVILSNFVQKKVDHIMALRLQAESLAPTITFKQARRIKYNFEFAKRLTQKTASNN